MSAEAPVPPQRRQWRRQCCRRRPQTLFKPQHRIGWPHPVSFFPRRGQDGCFHNCSGGLPPPPLHPPATLRLEPYAAQERHHWPPAGRHVLGQAGADAVVLYQVCCLLVCSSLVRCGQADLPGSWPLSGTAYAAPPPPRPARPTPLASRWRRPPRATSSASLASWRGASPG